MAPCRAPPPHLFAASIAPHAARRLNRAEASHQPSLGRALALHPRSISLPRRFPAVVVRALAHTPARPSIRPSVRPSARSLAFSLHPLFPSPFLASALHLAFSFRPLGPRTGIRSDARFPLSPSSSRHPTRALTYDVRCVQCAALRVVVCVVRFALCARPCPARRARGAARLGAPRRQVDDAMYVAQTVCNDDNRPTPLLSRIRISFHGQRRRRPLRKRSR